MFSCTSADTAALASHAGYLCHRPEIQSLTRRIGADLSRRGFVAGMGASIASLGLPGPARAQPVPAPTQRPILFTNFRLFEGTSGSLRHGLGLLVEGNRIKDVAGGTPRRRTARVINCGGRVIMPGLIDATGGHGDLRPLSDVPSVAGSPSRVEQSGGAIIADGGGAVRLRVREQLMQAASQIKLVGSGGVSTPRSPIDAAGFSEAELRACVEAAGDWSTYATVHAYTPATIQRAIAAGAACIEHGHLMDEATARPMSER